MDHAEPFPAEHDWLSLPPPLVSDGFVDDTVARILADRRTPEADHEPASLTRAQLDQFAPPAASPDFIASTMARLAFDRREHWRTLLARYVAPEPSAAFVDRTLRALRGQQVVPLRRSFLPLLLTAAAAVLLASLWWPAPKARSFEHVLADAIPASLSMRLSPAPLTTWTTMTDDAEDPLALPHGTIDSAWEWQRRQGNRR